MLSCGIISYEAVQIINNLYMHKELACRKLARGQSLISIFRLPCNELPQHVLKADYISTWGCLSLTDKEWLAKRKFSLSPTCFIKKYFLSFYIGWQKGESETSKWSKRQNDFSRCLNMLTSLFIQLETLIRMSQKTSFCCFLKWYLKHCMFIHNVIEF